VQQDDMQSFSRCSLQFPLEGYLSLPQSSIEIAAGEQPKETLQMSMSSSDDDELAFQQAISTVVSHQPLCLSETDQSRADTELLQERMGHPEKCQSQALPLQKLPNAVQCKLTSRHSKHSKAHREITTPTSSIAAAIFSSKPSEPLPKMTQASSQRRARAQRNSMIHISKEFLEQHGFFNMPLEVVWLPSLFTLSKP